jgi:PAS domain S-box-containing protein
VNVPNLFRTVQPFIAAIAVIATASTLVVAIFFTLLNLAWIAFLAGILFAGLIAVVSRATRAEYAAASSAAKLAIAEDKLLQEDLRGEKFETMLARANTLLQFAVEMQPAMVAYVDELGIYRYHNRAFARWLDLPSHRIDGHSVSEALGRLVFAQVGPAVTRALSGETVSYQRTHEMADGSSRLLNVQLAPVLATDGTPDGFYVIVSDATGAPQIQAPDASAGTSASGTLVESTFAGNAYAEQAQFNTIVAEHATGMPNAREYILSALENNKFLLFGQLIEPLDPSSFLPKYYEILIRLLEEEDNMISPGAFFPLAEENGLLPQLDRWVVANLLGWLANRQSGGVDLDQEVFFLNIAAATLCAADFPDYVVGQLHKQNYPGKILCFEIAESDVASNFEDVHRFIHAIKAAGCKVALSGFGRNRASVNVLKKLSLDFLKIDGSLILQIHRDPVSMSKVVAISRTAKNIGITTIAEMVEDDATLSSLRTVAIQYGQGFGISRPRRLSELF